MDSSGVHSCKLSTYVPCAPPSVAGNPTLSMAAAESSPPSSRNKAALKCSKPTRASGVVGLHARSSAGYGTFAFTSIARSDRADEDFAYCLEPMLPSASQYPSCMVRVGRSLPLDSFHCPSHLVHASKSISRESKASST